MSSKVSAATCGALSTLIREDTPPIAEEDGEHNGSEHLVIALGGQLSGVCCIFFLQFKYTLDRFTENLIWEFILHKVNSWSWGQ